MLPSDYLLILNRLLIKSRAIIREASNTYKIYLPSDYNDIWEEVRKQEKSVDVIVILPEQVQWIDKVLMKKRTLVKEGERFKFYLSKQYNIIWESLYGEGKKVDRITGD